MSLARSARRNGAVSGNGRVVRHRGGHKRLPGGGVPNHDLVGERLRRGEVSDVAHRPLHQQCAARLHSGNGRHRQIADLQVERIVVAVDEIDRRGLEPVVLGVAAGGRAGDLVGDVAVNHLVVDARGGNDL